MRIDPQPTLALATVPAPPTLARTRTRPGPTSVAVAIIAGGAMSTAVFVPAGLACMFAAAALLVVIGLRAGAAPLRRLLADSAVERDHQARRAARMRKLPVGSLGRDVLNELTYLADEVACRDPALAERLDLEGLLDRHVVLTLAHERALRAVAMVDRAQLERLCNALAADPRASPRRREMSQRRLRCQLECEAKAARIADELAIVSDLIRLIAQRAASPDELVVDEVIERQLAELDAQDAAGRLLAAVLTS